MHLKIHIDDEQCDALLVKVLRQELKFCKETLRVEKKHPIHTPELAAALNTVLNYFQTLESL